MICRLADERDFAELARMRRDFREEDGAERAVVDESEFLEICVDFLRSNAESCAYWVAAEAGEIVAHLFVQRVALVPRPCRPRDAFGYVTNVYTKPAFRGRGVGTELLKRAVDWARAEDFELLLVYPGERAIDFYRRAGFEPENEALKLVLREY
ncbi:MAG: GNAT family N-acetyltransferase [Acidobacteria bacterium]|nr:GNAT family N-acetyltransferase [Acidobacteriota bacterium]